MTDRRVVTDFDVVRMEMAVLATTVDEDEIEPARRRGEDALARLRAEREALIEAALAIDPTYNQAYPCNAACERGHWGVAHVGDVRPFHDALARLTALLSQL
jgi:hypothetical protein